MPPSSEKTVTCPTCGSPDIKTGSSYKRSVIFLVWLNVFMVVVAAALLFTKLSVFPLITLIGLLIGGIGLPLGIVLLAITVRSTMNVPPVYHCRKCGMRWEHRHRRKPSRPSTIDV
jgi:hypothetical protein